MASGIKPSHSFAAVAAPKSVSYKVRSASLPSRVHPLTAAVDHAVAALCALDDSSSPSSVSAAMAGTAAALLDLLHHPHAADALRSRRPFADRALDALLRLADVHERFRGALLALSPLIAEARRAVRRGDEPRLAAAARAQRQIARDVAHLATAVRSRDFFLPSHLDDSTADMDGDAAALISSVRSAIAALARASATVFLGVDAVMSDASTERLPSWASWAVPCTPISTPARAVSSTSSTARVWWLADLMRWASRAKRRSMMKEAAALPADVEELTEKMERAEECAAAVGEMNNEVYRAVVSSRVAMLNILTPSF